MRLVFPNSHRINRGNYVIKELANNCRANDVTNLIVLHEHHGVPGTCANIVSHFPYGPTIYLILHNVTLQHDIGSYKSSTVSEQYPHLIFEDFKSKLGGRVRDVLKFLFPVPKEDSKQVGPHFEIKSYEIRQGTIGQTEAEREWVLAHYTRTAKKRNLLPEPAAHSTTDSDRTSSKRQKR
ncbi:brix domain-containing protein [Suillus lakei]|nr:brix domain-containing protein [Suillus lakei]